MHAHLLDWRPARDRDRAFTIIEMLIAMAVTMVLMGALAQTFKLLGQRMQDSRARVELSNQLRGITYQMRTQLAAHTASTAAIPVKQSEASGYFVYYEGPMHDMSTTLFAQQPTVTEKSYQDSKIGDFDDYIAFTAEAPGDAWFTGKVPRFVADPSVLTRSMPSAEKLAPTVIRSKYAEIVYWISPEVQRNGDGTPTLDQTSGMPLYVDNDADGIPDRLLLRRRVFLIRPDLNLPDLGTLPIFEFSDANGSNVRIGDLPTVNGNLAMPYIDRSNTYHPSSMQNSHWLTGLAFMNQMLDLSIRRVPIVGTGSLAVGSSNKSNLAANSLADLTMPENRFAHVRIPGEYFNLANNTCTTMPLLALGYNPGLLAPAPSTLVSPPGLYVGSTKQPLMNGFLLPQFELSYLPASVTGNLDWDRTGEDVLAYNVLAFDVQAYDENASNLLTFGDDGAPGVAGINDMNGGSSGADQSLYECGATGSDDALITVNDLEYWQAIQNGCYPDISRPMAANGPLAVAVRRGGFVDLGYLFQIGSPLAAPVQQLTTNGLPGFYSNGNPYSVVRRYKSLTGIAQAQLNSDFSGLDAASIVANPAGDEYYCMTISSLRESGKAAFSSKYGSNNRNPQLLYCQPVYDTWSDHYESDGFDQGMLASGADGTFYIYNKMESNNSSPDFGKLVPALTSVYGGSAGSARDRIDEGSNGVDDNGIGGTDDNSERETAAPFPTTLQSVRVRVRLEDTASGEIMESTVIADLQ